MEKNAVTVPSGAHLDNTIKVIKLRLLDTNTNRCNKVNLTSEIKVFFLAVSYCVKVENYNKVHNFNANMKIVAAVWIVTLECIQI